MKMEKKRVKAKFRPLDAEVACPFVFINTKYESRSRPKPPLVVPQRSLPLMSIVPDLGKAKPKLSTCETFRWDTNGHNLQNIKHSQMNQKQELSSFQALLFLPFDQQQLLEAQVQQSQGVQEEAGQKVQQGSQTPAPSNFSGSGPAKNPEDLERDKIYKWILELSNANTRENAMLELSSKREEVLDLAPMLWYSFGTMAALLQEIVSIYPHINPPTLTAQQSNRVCNAVALFECVAAHSETRSLFLQAQTLLFLYPLLKTVSKTRPFERLRLTCLRVIEALFTNGEQDVINFLLTTEIISICYRIMESGNESSKTVPRQRPEWASSLFPL